MIVGHHIKLEYTDSAGANFADPAQSSCIYSLMPAPALPSPSPFLLVVVRRLSSAQRMQEPRVVLLLLLQLHHLLRLFNKQQTKRRSCLIFLSSNTGSIINHHCTVLLNQAHLWKDWFHPTSITTSRWTLGHIVALVSPLLSLHLMVGLRVIYWSTIYSSSTTPSPLRNVSRYMTINTGEVTNG